MPRKPPPLRRARVALRWPLGITLTTARYLSRTTPFHRSEEEGSLDSDAPPPLPSGVSQEEVQLPEHGAGPLFHRRYRTRIRDCDLSPEAFVDELATHLAELAPREFASFEKTLGDPDGLDVGDEYLVQMAGPYDGPVRVVERKPASFRLVTLDTHLEAGQIDFRARREDGLLVFEIESWARSKDPFVNLLYHHLRMAKETQVHMWISLLERATKHVGGRMTGGIDIHTRRVAYQVGDPVRMSDGS